jgi:hypothetical protein
MTDAGLSAFSVFFMQSPSLFVCPNGHEQQDCEINASLRWLDSRGSPRWARR